MAKMHFRPAGESSEFGCYSERGLMSYLMFFCLPKPEKLSHFLKQLEFPVDVQSPFSKIEEPLYNTVLFSELEFGNKGFGCPDGAIYVECPHPTMLFIETKLNQRYDQSCQIKNKDKYNSTIQGQLELRWRLSHLHYKKLNDPVDENNIPFNNAAYIVETPELKKVYSNNDRFYKHSKQKDSKKLRSWRRLKITGGVACFLKKLGECKNRVYFCAITQDPPEENPFTNPANKEFLPNCGGIEPEHWDKAKHQFCWMSAEKLVEFTEPNRISPNA